ncbi:hypothetical protein L2D00_05910 [Hyphomonadaceae bacterium BL14]|nr:hypothetical protein L2D00_05910 [Hyphomonadaceae bacterium BL14]
MNEILKPKDLWERGVSLQNAWETLALAEEVAERATLDAWKPEIAGKGPKSFLDGLSAIANGALEVQRNLNLRKELRNRFEERILDELFNEELYGYGYPVTPSPARMPRRIDPAFWENPVVEWHEGKARLDNIAFNRIRIVNPERYPQFDLSPKRPGPISHAETINWAIALHTESEPDFWQKSDHIRIQRMRKSINVEFGIDTNSVRGFGDKTFQKYLLEFKKVHSK